MATVSGRVLVVTLDGPGAPLARTLAAGLPAELTVVRPPGTPRLPEVVRKAFKSCRALVMVMAGGIAARVAGPLLQSKYQDPAVVFVDRAGRYAVSLTGGHEGGANQLACDVASLSGGEPVITTGTEADRTVAVGIGYRRRATGKDIRQAINSCLGQCGLTEKQVRFLSTALFKWEDSDLRKVAAGMGLLLRYFSTEQLSRIDGVSAPSRAAMKYFTLKGVSEQCALLSLRNAEIILPRTATGPVTVSIAVEKLQQWASDPETRKI